MRRLRLFVGVIAAICLTVGVISCKRESNGGSKPPPPPSQGRVTIGYETLPSILIEAESGEIVTPVQIFEDSQASDGKYCLAPEGPDHKEINVGGHVDYRLTVEKQGDYTLWLRTKWCCSCGDSLEVLLAEVGADGKRSRATLLGTVKDSLFQEWHWVVLRARKVPLTRGEYVLTIRNREDGSAFDQILLTQDKDYIATGIESSDVPNRTVLSGGPVITATETPSTVPMPATTIPPPLQDAAPQPAGQ